MRKESGARKKMCQEKDVQGKRCAMKRVSKIKDMQGKGNGCARKRKWMCKENPKLENPKLKVCRRQLGAMAVRGDGS